ncbi:urease accessory protein UreF [Corynebacterium liangguodongii]|uniref:Urease accessory protein UreF n=1 Tax=Corynebacterium liangguodongii TaxID=2079535 RepID=A0A2S0WEV8_9CORY|nr:urease accessory protein UreF [Corynebacterium liangguodongii]AWB84296.1 urease accessory protein UreF [Corynebacterium liangguodongii]PWB99787.1 urease accessory protein UreF [Corynebacterium liangguodongii]
MADLTRLLTGMQLADSALPTGAFAHSFGFESYLESGVIESAEGFARWLESFIGQQLTFTDALAIRLVMGAGEAHLVERLDQLVTAQALPAQVREAGMTMGRRLLTISAANYPSEALSAYAEAIEEGRAFGHPAIVWALVARGEGIDPDTAVAQHVYACVISLVQNAVRAIPLGQNAGQRLIRQAQPWVVGAVEASQSLREEDLGAIAPGLEIAQMNHERQHSRLFMS